MAIQFITGNKNKFAEASAILGDVLVQRDIDLPEIQEIDPKAILQKKLEAAFAHEQGEFVVEDTSLYFECLHNQLPGPLIKWFLKSIGLEGLVGMVNKMGVNSAYVQVIVAYAKNPNEIYFFDGTLQGAIVSPRGEGFGFDAIFEVAGSNKTFGEMTPEEKNTISHRGQAFKKLKDFLDTK